MILNQNLAAVLDVYITDIITVSPVTQKAYSFSKLFAVILGRLFVAFN